MGKKALVAMSGGVDSSVAALLMKEAGFECAGVTMKLFDGDSRCCSLSDVNDARDASYKCGIPHYVLNFKDEFKKNVIERFIAVYEAGGTPNPCIDCNRFLKFGALLERAKQLGFDFFATGHYARIEIEQKADGGKRFLLKKARDAKKDQSYFLYMMTQAQLAKTIFPLGDFTKDEVREFAQKNGFVNAKKRDSEDICFVPDGDYGSFMEGYLGKKYLSGNIIDIAGKVIGRHRGAVKYTLGQRRGLNCSSSAGRLYVAAKSIADNTITLAGEESLYSSFLYASALNFIALERIDGALKLKARTRYMQKEVDAVARMAGDDLLRVDFMEPQRAITGGQALVLYDGDIVVGGGTIM